MALTVHSAMVIRDEQFRAGFIEAVANNTAIFNENSGGAITLVTDPMEGYYDKTSFYDTLSSGISRRDLTSTTTATGKALTTDEIIGVKIFRTLGPYDFTLGSLKTVMKDPAEMSFEIGEELGKYLLEDMVNSALRAGASALATNAGAKTQYTTAGQTLTHARVNTGIGKFGDKRGMIQTLVMHSTNYNNLVGDAITNYKIDSVGGAAIVAGDPRVNLGRPIVISDSASLVVADGVTSGTDTYLTLGLVQNAITVTVTEPLEYVEYFVDRAQITLRVHGEVAYNLKVKGFQWDTSNGGANPTDATVATATNWDNAVASIKNQAGIYLETPGA